MTDRVLAIDLGTSSTKLLVAGRDGTVLARRRLTHTTSRSTTAVAEQDPGAWWRDLVAGVARLRADLPNGVGIAGIGVTGQMHGLVVHDADGRVLRPAITWEDRRSAATLPDLLAALPEGRPAIAAGYQAASWHWLARHEPEHAGRARHLLLPKDAIVWRLTGARVTDPSDAVGTGWYDVANGAWAPAVLVPAGARLDMLPDIIPSGSVAGGLSHEAAGALGLDPGIPVIVAGGDAAVAAFGAGATDPATPLVMLSTGCQALQPALARPDADAWPAAGPAGLPRWLRVATTLNGGNVVEWARRSFGAPSRDVDPDLVFLPFLAGERSPAIALDASGAFVGLRARHRAPDLARASIDGVALGLADAFARAGGQIGGDAPVLAGGGGTRDADWLASLAGALARPVAAIVEPDLSAWGAARSAATALGWIDPVATPAAWRPGTQVVDPATTAEATLARLDRFRALATRLFAPEGS